jgi:hypothetical protein
MSEWQHIPQTCPLCADMFNPATTTVSHYDCIKHLLFKVADLENRLLQVEWRNMPIGPCSDEYGTDIEEKRLDAIRKVLGKKEPDCAICYDEEGSWTCIRPAHAVFSPTQLHLHEFVPPPNDDEQQCDADCRANWHKCKTCGKTRTELGLP